MPARPLDRPSPEAKPAPERRRRLPAAEAKGRILAAAQKRLTESGPDAIRLKDLARDLGISHPTILHHFGSREGLIEALERHAMAQLEADLLRPSDTEETLERVHRTLGDEGHARLLAWMVLSRREREPLEAEPTMLRTLAEAVHRERLAAGHASAAPEDSVFSVRLVAAAMFGEALLGPILSWSAGLQDDPSASRRFRAWLARLLEDLDRADA